MKLLIIGQGGREHAFYTKFKEDHPNDFIKILPGNGGITQDNRLQGSSTDFGFIENYSKENSIDTILVGPEQPLVEGIADTLNQKDVYVFGPSKFAANLEGSKAFAKDFMKKYNIPTAGYEIFEDFNKAKKYILESPKSLVIKASGLAAGKGVTVCSDPDTAIKAAELSLSGLAFGESGKKIVIEDCLKGKEVSIFAVCDGKNYKIIGTAQDYKRAYDDDKGANTGGMGAFSPAAIVDDKLLKEIKETVLEPTLKGMEKEGHPYTGILYLGLMIDNGKPFVIEYNCRMGDPETQVVMPLLTTPLGDILKAAREKSLDKLNIRHRQGYAVTVVLAKEGYPETYSKGQVINGIDRNFQGCKLYHAGTERNSKGQIISTGGRVLNFTGLGTTLKEARDNAYKAISSIETEGFFYRKDIAQKYI